MAKNTKMDRSAKIMVWRYAKQKMDVDTMSDLVGVAPSVLRPWLSRKFRDEAEELWKAIIKKDGVCAINDDDCGDKLDAHHLISKASHPHLRHVIMNGIALCGNHHMWNPMISGHFSTSSADNLVDWLAEYRPDQYEWFIEHKHDKAYQKIDTEEVYWMLLEEIAA